MLQSDVWAGHWIHTQWQCDLEKPTTLCFQISRLNIGTKTRITPQKCAAFKHENICKTFHHGVPPVENTWCQTFLYKTGVKEAYEGKDDFTSSADMVRSIVRSTGCVLLHTFQRHSGSHSLLVHFFLSLGVSCKTLWLHMSYQIPRKILFFPRLFDFQAFDEIRLSKFDL